MIHYAKKKTQVIMWYIMQKRKSKSLCDTLRQKENASNYVIHYAKKKKQVIMWYIMQKRKSK